MSEYFLKASTSFTEGGGTLKSCVLLVVLDETVDFCSGNEVAHAFELDTAAKASTEKKGKSMVDF